MSLTIAIPFYNAEKYLTDSIRSIFAQSYQDWELILIDDGSTDGSLNIAKSVEDKRVRVISDGKNLRLAARLNQITHLAKYDYIARMDADDLIFPEKLELQMKILISNPNIDVITTGVYSVLNDLSIKGVRGSDYEYPTFRELLTRKVGFTHAALIAKKSWYKRNKYDESLSIGQDLDLWLSSSKKNDFKVKSISDPLYIYREEDNVTKDKILRAYKNERVMISKYADGLCLPLYFKSCIKSLAVFLLDISGNINSLQAKRANENVSEFYSNKLNDALKKIQNTKIPGIDD